MSRKNIAWLRKLAAAPEEDVAHVAGLLHEVALISPHRKKRRGVLYHHHRVLFDKLVEAGLLDHPFEYLADPEPPCELQQPYPSSMCAFPIEGDECE